MTYNWQFRLRFAMSQEFVRLQVVFEAPANKRDTWNNQRIHGKKQQCCCRVYTKKSLWCLATCVRTKANVWIEVTVFNRAMASVLTGVNYTCPAASRPLQTSFHPWPSGLLESRKKKHESVVSLIYLSLKWVSNFHLWSLPSGSGFFLLNICVYMFGLELGLGIGFVK